MCSDAGICDTALGECQCNSQFTGSACELSECCAGIRTSELSYNTRLTTCVYALPVKCPGEPACNGRGQCMSIRQLSLEADADSPSLRFDYGVDPNNAQTFDRDSILGCKCDPGFEGYDCSQREFVCCHWSSLSVMRPF